jgi:hypothetical protein
MTQTLSPVGPPTGHRRARRYAAEMVELRRQGYTFEAIREALAGAGVDVCNSTVQREVARYERRLRPTDAGSAGPEGKPGSRSA